MEIIEIVGGGRGRGKGELPKKDILEMAGSIAKSHTIHHAQSSINDLNICSFSITIFPLISILPQYNSISS